MLHYGNVHWWREDHDESRNHGTVSRANISYSFNGGRYTERMVSRVNGKMMMYLEESGGALVSFYMHFIPARLVPL